MTLAEYAFEQMYDCMRKAEQKSAEYTRDYGIIAQDDLDSLAAKNGWYINQANMYANIFMAAELGEESPNKEKYQAAIKRVEAAWHPKQNTGARIPTQRK